MTTRRALESVSLVVTVHLEEMFEAVGKTGRRVVRTFLEALDADAPYSSITRVSWCNICWRPCPDEHLADLGFRLHKRWCPIRLLDVRHRTWYNPAT